MWGIAYLEEQDMLKENSTCWYFVNAISYSLKIVLNWTIFPVKHKYLLYHYTSSRNQWKIYYTQVWDDKVLWSSELYMNI